MNFTAWRSFSFFTLCASVKSTQEINAEEHMAKVQRNVARRSFSPISFLWPLNSTQRLKDLEREPINQCPPACLIFRLVSAYSASRRKALRSSPFNQNLTAFSKCSRKRIASSFTTIHLLKASETALFNHFCSMIFTFCDRTAYADHSVKVDPRILLDQASVALKRMRRSSADLCAEAHHPSKQDERAAFAILFRQTEIFSRTSMKYWVFSYQPLIAWESCAFCMKEMALWRLSFLCVHTSTYSSQRFQAATI